jgi:hypothetical protein
VNSSFALARGLFARGLALTYAAAFLSFGVQARGLVGTHGILPAADLLEAARRHFGDAAWLELPSVFWLRADDAALLAVCTAGVALSIALFFGIAPRITAAALWALYLSLLPVGQIFLGYQWDALLLETGLLAIWFVPGGLHVPIARTRTPSIVPLVLLRWLVFRLFLLSGLVKLLSGDPSWLDLSAMTFHFWTQPLPNPLSPFAHALPIWMNQGTTLVTLIVELGLPWCVFGPRPLRLAAAAGFAGMMIAINATGNYGWFGLLSCVLCIPLVDDAVWRRLPGLRSLPPAPVPERRASPAARAANVAAYACGALVVAITTGAALQRIGADVPGPLRALMRATHPLASFHGYGLFAQMTKDRPEIEIEGSRDGATWLAYEFRYKPDRLDESPREAGLHMPRLDWQMWFSALGSCNDDRWFLAFLRRLLEAEPRVLALLARDPFDGERPQYVRTTLYRYRFSDGGWSREELGPYCPTVRLEGDALRVATPDAK